MTGGEAIQVFRVLDGSLGGTSGKRLGHGLSVADGGGAVVNSTKCMGGEGRR